MIFSEREHGKAFINDKTAQHPVSFEGNGMLRRPDSIFHYIVAELAIPASPFSWSI